MKPIARGDWFAIEDCGEGISHLWEPHVIEKTRCNIWHVKGEERDLVIDSGMGLASLGEFLGLRGKSALACVPA